jgi:hypothetical protein
VFGLEEFYAAASRDDSAREKGGGGEKGGARPTTSILNALCGLCRHLRCLQIEDGVAAGAITQMSADASRQERGVAKDVGRSQRTQTEKAGIATDSKREELAVAKRENTEHALGMNKERDGGYSGGRERRWGIQWGQTK